MGLQRDVKGLIKGKVRFNEPLSEHTSFGIGGPAEVWAEPEDLEDLAKLVRYSSTNDVRIFIIGGGNNLLVRDEGIPGITISLTSKNFKRIESGGPTGLRADSGVRIQRLVEVAGDKGLGGLEFMVGIPGTVGGAVMMNAGCFDRSFGDLVRKIGVMDKNGKVVSLGREEINFGYRSSDLEGFIVLDIFLELKPKASLQIDKAMKRYLQMKRHRGELDLPSAGSIFKNPAGTQLLSGRLIELSGFKGRSCGRAQVWPKHCNFIVNLGGATAKDVVTLIDQIQSKVRSDHGINLELEVKVV